MRLGPRRALICALALAWMLPGLAHAQFVFDPVNYTTLADADATDTIPVGTRITLQNWQQYRKFMPMALVAAYSQRYGFKIGDDPKYTINVGPTTPVPMFKQLRDNTEKYAGQTRLAPSSSGGYTMEGYVAGVPFPKPSGPLMPYQLLYNVWTYYFPSISYFDGSYTAVDRYRNRFYEQIDVDQWRLSHSSDEGFPTNPSYGAGFMQATRLLVGMPEQERYTAQLALLPDDPEKVQEIYVFVPALRRSVRMSSAARCSPLLGSDFNQDDNSDGVFFQPPNFKATLLGARKVLAVMHGDLNHWYGGDLTGGEQLYDREGVPGWPSPIAARWELRDVYVLDLAPLPILGDYCYGHKVIFIDKETFVQLYLDDYDAAGRLFKGQLIWHTLINVNDHERYILRGHDPQTIIDWRNIHATTSLPNRPPEVNHLNHREVSNHPELYAFPGGLAYIMK
ncbi:MAG TPA: DUF1329 domain-containing protein [Candidatus Binataceae bacterium]|jgi:hypothetical protein|nr:DUF1329 domain-containing protein [Candidatus Binataceae bacterium]